MREGGNGLAWTWTWMEEQIEEGFGRERRGAEKRFLVCVRLPVLVSFLFYRAPCTGHTWQMGVLLCWDIPYSYGPSPLEEAQLASLEWHVKPTPTEGSLVNFHLPI